MYHFIKRLFDIIASLVALVVFALVWVAAIVGIFVSDPGPIFYFANRVGKDNKTFRMYKFRSMRVDINADEKSLRPDQQRIFKWGRIMRKTKIDELPQLINVLVGDMSLIGPRPVAKDQKHLFRYGKYDMVKKVRPGITGPAALYDYVYGDQFEEDIDEYMEKVYPTRRELEYVYINKEGLLFDTWIFFETAWCVICSIICKENDRLLIKLIDMAHDSNPDLKIEKSKEVRRVTR